MVEEELPLKQGLKHLETRAETVSHNRVEEELPLKQGLKPNTKENITSEEMLLKRNFH